MATFGQRGQAGAANYAVAREDPRMAELRQSYPKQEPHFEAHWPKYVGLAAAALSAVLIPSAYDLSKGDLFALPQIALLFGFLALWLASFVKYGFRVDEYATSPSARHPMAAFVGLFGGLIVGMISVGVGPIELFTIDWIGEMFTTAKVNGADPVSWQLLQYAEFGAVMTLLVSVWLSRLAQQDDD
ncbi:MAG: hypothetical protein AAF441_06195 [Pseudomonadota bacterium]